jgi:PKD repeat protein
MTLDGRNLADPDGTVYQYDWLVAGNHYSGAVSQPVPVVEDQGDSTHATVVLTVTDPAFPDDPTVVTKAIVVHHPPHAKFSPPAGDVQTNQAVTFNDESSDPENDIETWSWKVDGADQGAGDPTTHALQYTFTTPGEHKVSLTVTDRDGNTNATDTKIQVATQPPVASFTYSPSDPIAGQEIQLDAQGSSDPDGTALTYAWETTGDDQFDDGSGATQSVTFGQPGDYTVKLRVTDADGASTVATQTITVKSKPNVAPTAGFTFAPSDPIVGQAVTFTSTSSDSDGTIAKYLWDVNNDGKFVEGGPTLTATFSRAAAQTVALKVIDDAGATATAFKTVNVRPAPVTTPPQDKAKTSATATPAPLNPFPIVRMRGLIMRRGVNIQILSIRAPAGATVSVRCRGRGCPAKHVRVKLKHRGLQIHQLEHHLRVGTVIEIRITKKGAIGKYTRFVVRANAAPSRRDLCLAPSSKRPVRCAA